MKNFVNVQMEIECVSYKGRCKISHVYNGGHEGQYSICDEYCEHFCVKGWATVLDGRETHHEVFKGYFGLQIMPWREGL